MSKQKIKSLVRKILPYGLVELKRKSHKNSEDIYYVYKNKYLNLLQKNTCLEQKKSRFIFIFWYQGFENAPLIIKKCVKSIESELGSKYRLIKIDKSNIYEYVTLPEYITKKFKERKFSITHYSDLIRLNLLVNKGGMWIDASVMLTHYDLDSTFRVITKQNLFLFKEATWEKSIRKVSSWFIYAKSNNLILNAVYLMMLDYWKHNNYLKNYYLFHIFFRIAADFYSNEFDNMICFNNVNPHMLQMSLFNRFNIDEYKYIIKISCIHKLTYKFNKNDEEMSNTFFKYIVNKK